MTLTKDETTDARYLRAIGRDVDLSEDQLHFDPDTRTLALTGQGSRREAEDGEKLSTLAVYVVRAARQMPGASVADLTRALRGMEDAPAFRDREVSRAAKYAEQQGQMRLESEGAGKPTRHYPVDPTTPSNPVHGRTRYPVQPRLYRTGYGVRGPGRGTTSNGVCLVSEALTEPVPIPPRHAKVRSGEQWPTHRHRARKRRHARARRPGRNP